MSRIFRAGPIGARTAELLLFVIILAALTAGGCGKEDSNGSGTARLAMTPREFDRDRNPYSLIWISLDTLRADHLGHYGYERETSPFIDELAQRGLSFEWTVTPQNTTLPSHMTMFTGYHPTVHQIMYSNSQNPGVRLASSVRTLPEILYEAGFATRAWTDGGKMASIHGFDRGFQKYVDDPDYLPNKFAEALQFIDGCTDGQPYFCLIHTYQVHRPYPAPMPYDKRFVTPGARSEAQRCLDLYDGCIRFVDDQLRLFVGDLEARGALDDTILVITGDHGENFQEYGFDDIGHRSPNLHQNITHVPWIMVHPDKTYQNRSITALTGLIDFPNTLLALLGFDEVLPGGGVNVLDPANDKPREYLSWTMRSLSLYSGDYHLFECEDGNGKERIVLYRFTDDRREFAPLDDQARIDAMRARLAEKRQALREQSRAITSSLREFGPEPKPGGKLMKQLRALGYVK